MGISLAVLAAFALFFVLWYYRICAAPFPGLFARSKALGFTVNYLLAGLVPLAVLLVLHGRGAAASLGLCGGFLRGAGFAALAVVPMFAGALFVGALPTALSCDQALRSVVVAGLFEELFFRGFLFGQLFRYARWGFLPAALMVGVVFGILHIYQGRDLVSALSAFAVTGLGSVFFCWIYVEQEYDLWSVVWLHALMNAAWIFCDTHANGAVGGGASNLLRVATLLLAVSLTLWRKRRHGLPYRITRKNLLYNE